jgi:hypothetical protein
LEQCFRLRSTAAAYKLSQGEHPHPHDSLGEPVRESYAKLVAALAEGTFAALESVPLGGVLKLSNPLAENAFDLEGLDSCQFTMPAPPDCASAAQAAELVELYWQSLTRDVPFSRWDRDATIAAAAAEKLRTPLDAADPIPHSLQRVAGRAACVAVFSFTGTLWKHADGAALRGAGAGPELWSERRGLAGHA